MTATAHVGTPDCWRAFPGRLARVDSFHLDHDSGVVSGDDGEVGLLLLARVCGVMSWVDDGG